METNLPLFLNIVFGFAFLWCALDIAFEDYKNMIVPDSTLLVLVFTGITYGMLNLESWDIALVELAVRGAVPGVFSLLVSIVYRLIRGRQGLGFGDVKLVAAAGLWLPASTSLLTIGIASLAAALIMLPAAFLSEGRRAFQRPLPFAVFLAPAFWLSWAALGMTSSGNWL